MSKILKWAGSKANIFHQLEKHLDFDKPYVEPFCGSSAFFFAGKPRVAHLNDANDKLINFYLQLQQAPEPLWALYYSYPVSQDDYYYYRAKFNQERDEISLAALFLYLNHYSFNGIYRTNSSGAFNTPYGANKKIKQKLTLEQILNASTAVQAATFSCDDFQSFIEELGPVGHTIYMDPPYHTQETRVFKEYGASVFSEFDLRRLKKICVSLSYHNKVVVSYKRCTDFADMFGEHIIGEISVTRNVGGFTGRRKADLEYVAVLEHK